MSFPISKILKFTVSFADEQIITPTIISCSAGKVVSLIDNFRTLYGTHSIVGRSVSMFVSQLFILYKKLHYN